MKELKDLKEILEEEIEICDRFSQAKSLSLQERSYYDGRRDGARLILYFVERFIGKDE